MAPEKNKGSHLNYFACQILPMSVQKEDITTSGGKNNRKARSGWLEAGSAHRRQAAGGSVEILQATVVRDLDQPSFFALQREMHVLCSRTFCFALSFLQFAGCRVLDFSATAQLFGQTAYFCL